MSASASISSRHRVVRYNHHKRTSSDREVPVHCDRPLAAASKPESPATSGRSQIVAPVAIEPRTSWCRWSKSLETVRPVADALCPAAHQGECRTKQTQARVDRSSNQGSMSMKVRGQDVLLPATLVGAYPR